MKGLILAGGTGSRLNPLTKVTNKHLLPVYDKPMIYYPLQTLIDSGIKDIMIVTGRESAGDFLDLLGSGEDFGVNLTYRLQDKADGICGALRLAEDFGRFSKLAVILGDNIYENNFREEFKKFDEREQGAEVFIREVRHPYRFGVVEFDKEGKVISIEEKPDMPKSNYIVTGLYLYDENVFDYIRQLKPSARMEYEVTDLNNIYLNKKLLTVNKFKGFWSDAGTFKSLQQSNEFMSKKK